MPSTQRRMKLSHDEEHFLRHWIFDEAHYQSGVGPPKRLQLERRVTPADLGAIIAAAMPEPGEQASAAADPPAAAPTWPWTRASLQNRLAEARTILAERHQVS